MPRSYELEKTSFTKSFGDSHTAIALEVALNLKANNIYLVGYDGYQNSMITQKETNLVNENELLFKDFSTFSGITLKSFTKSQYNNIQLVSIYTYIYE